MSKESVKTWADFNAAIAAGQKPETLLGLDDMVPHRHGNKEEHTSTSVNQQSLEERLSVYGFSESPLQFRYSHFKQTDLLSCKEPLKLDMITTPPHLPITQLLGPCCVGSSELTTRKTQKTED
ncbi:uncharacterized protein [Ptychodera flava]|uniref:uncharacterized protein n=1 Tax=Ptychodera flava TaxID=63121 RepID=UPI003969FF60